MREDRYFQAKHREEILRRYNYRCANCGSEDDLEIHHIVPVSLGGNDTISNLVPLCFSCHKAAHNGRDIHKYLRSTGRSRGGRPSKMPFDEFDKWFEKYLHGEIGKRKLLEVTGYCFETGPKSNVNIRRSMDVRGIDDYKNVVDLRASVSVLKDGDCVGYIKYKDGRKKNVYYHDTGLNDVEYCKRQM